MLFEDLAISDGAVVGTHARFALGGVGIVGALALGSRVVVHHGVHCACRYAEEKAWFAQLSEVAMVPVPVWLRHKRHPIARMLQHTPNNRRTKLRMVHIRITGEEDDIHFVPSADV